jgi:hypothetical protein
MSYLVVPAAGEAGAAGGGAEGGVADGGVAGLSG